MDMVAAELGTVEALMAPARRPAMPCWQELAAQASEANPFYHPALLGPALDHLDAERQVRVIEARSDGRLIGLLPIILRDRHARYPVRNAANWVHEQCFFGAPLLRTGEEQKAWAEILTQLDAADWAGHFLHLESLDSEGPVAAALLACCAAQGRKITAIATHDRALLRSNLTADEYWQANVRAKKRKDIRRRINRLEETGTVTHSRLRDGGDVAAWTEDFLALECSGWKGEEGTALDSSEHSRAFFRAALANAARENMLDMLRIDFDGAAIAMLVNFYMGPGAYSYKTAFNERFGRFSPGVLIEIDTLRAALSDPQLDWMDSCAAPGHPMIDGIWAERRSIVQYRVALKGRGWSGIKRRTAFAATGLAEKLIRAIKRESR